MAAAPITSTSSSERESRGGGKSGEASRREHFARHDGFAEVGGEAIRRHVRCRGDECAADDGFDPVGRRGYGLAVASDAAADVLVAG